MEESRGEGGLDKIGREGTFELMSPRVFLRRLPSLEAEGHMVLSCKISCHDIMASFGVHTS